MSASWTVTADEFAAMAELVAGLDPAAFSDPELKAVIWKARDAVQRNVTRVRFVGERGSV